MSPVVVLKFLLLQSLHISPIIPTFSHSLQFTLIHSFITHSAPFPSLCPSFFPLMGRREKFAKQKAILKIPQGVFTPINLYGSTNTRAHMPKLAKTAKEQNPIFFIWSSQLKMDYSSLSSILMLAPSL